MSESNKANNVEEKELKPDTSEEGSQVDKRKPPKVDPMFTTQYGQRNTWKGF